MTVEPGFGGQKFMENMMKKVERIRAEYPLLDIQVDGGICAANIDQCSNAGANMIVSGTGIICTENPAQTIAYLRSSVNNAIEKKIFKF